MVVAAVLVVLNLLAFALHTACELAEDQWQRARQRLGTRARLFEHLRTLAEYQVFPSWNALVVLLAAGSPAALSHPRPAPTAESPTRRIPKTK